MISYADSSGLEGCAALSNTMAVILEAGGLCSPLNMMAVNLEAYLPTDWALRCWPCPLQVFLMWSQALPTSSPCSGSRLRQCCLPTAHRHVTHISPPARVWLALLSCMGQEKSLPR